MYCKKKKMPIRRRKYHGLYFHSSAPRGKWNVKFIQHIFLFSIVIERGTKHSRWWTVGNVWGCQLHESKQALGWINCAFIFQNFENSNSNWTWQRFFFVIHTWKLGKVYAVNVDVKINKMFFTSTLNVSLSWKTHHD